MQSSAPTDSEHTPQAGEAPLDVDPSPAPPKAGSSGQNPGDKTPSKGNGEEPDPRFEATRYEATKKATIMLIDDEPIIVEILKSVLEDVGYRSFIETTESTRALQLMEEHKPDVVLLDVTMPEVSGLDILNSMRSNENLRHIPAIVLTGATDSATKLVALGLGAGDVLGKPVDPSELALRVRNILTAKAHQDRLLNFDDLTRLPNRHFFMQRSAHALTRIDGATHESALLLIGLDNYQQVNDTLGTEFADSLLRTVAATLEEHIRESDLPGLSGVDEEEIALSRIDGDEFALIIPHLTHVDVADLLSRRLLSMLEKPFHVGARDIHITASIGISIFPGDGKNTDELLASAGAALSQAKKSSGNAYRHHSKEHNVKSEEREKLEAQLQLAPARNELYLSIQPKLEVDSDRVSGTDGRLRWRHSQWGIVPSEKFLPIAEETGLIIPAGEKAIELACTVNKQWQVSGMEPVGVSMSVSGRQFRNVENLANTVRRVLEKTGLDGKFLTLKFPEAVLMENPERNLKSLQDLKSLGVRLCLDHFGTGLSSMGYLRHFPIEEIVIDNTLVKDIPGNADAAAVLIAAIKLAKGMGLKVIAEGVRTQDQLDSLKKWGCDEFLGKLSMTRSIDWQKSAREALKGFGANRKNA